MKEVKKYIILIIMKKKYGFNRKYDVIGEWI